MRVSEVGCPDCKLKCSGRRRVQVKQRLCRQGASFGQTARLVAGAPLPHGGPESQYRPSFHFLIQYLVHNGYAVLAPNVRGSTGYGKAYSHLDDVEKRMDSVADLAHALGLLIAIIVWANHRSAEAKEP